MKSRDAVGRRIVRVQQHRHNDAVGGPAMAVEYLELDNGTRLYPIAVETEEHPLVEILVNKLHRVPVPRHSPRHD